MCNISTVIVNTVYSKKIPKNYEYSQRKLGEYVERIIQYIF